MQRVAFVLRLHPDKVEAYRQTHRAVWPEMIAANRSAGVRNHSMFLHGNLAFGYLECDDYAKTRAILDKSDVVKRWGELHLDIFDPGDGDGPAMQILEEAFHQD
jgi:L-rhamnose mutarotase